MEKVLFVCTHGIGDLIMTLPAIRLMADSGFAVHVLLKAQPEEEVALQLLGERDLSFGHLSRREGNQVSTFIRLAKAIRKQNFDFAFAQFGVDPMLFAALAFAGRAGYRVGWKGPGSILNSRSLEPRGQHKTLENARYLDFLGITYSADDLRFEDLRQPQKIDSGVVVMAPSAGQIAAHRAWPKANYAELAARLVADLDVDVEIVGGKEDVVLCNEIAAGAGTSRVTSLAGRLDIKGLFELLQQRALLIANCNGVSHIAAAIGLPVVGLYGPTAAVHTGPFSPKLTAVSRNLECSPCYRRGYTQGCGNPVCMSGIPVDTVYDTVHAVLQETRRGRTQRDGQQARRSEHS